MPGKAAMSIKIDETDKKKIRIFDDQGNDRTDEMKPLPRGGLQLGKIKEVQTATIIFEHSSPGCVTYIIGGRYYRICT